MADWAVIEIATGTVHQVTIVEAAEITGIGEEEILWAIEEEGRCDTRAYVVVDVVDAAAVTATL